LQKPANGQEIDSASFFGAKALHSLEDYIFIGAGHIAQFFIVFCRNGHT